jgi:hypothetical protein
MSRFVILLAAWCAFAGFASTERTLVPAQSFSARVRPSAIWQPALGQLIAIRTKCMKGDPAKPDECFLSEMRAAGVSPEAIAFSRSLADTGYGYLRDFLAEGRVDIAFVEYFFRANELRCVFLVNGLPSMLDVDHMDLFPSDEVAKNDSYHGLLQRHPNLEVFPGDRFHTDEPVGKSRGAGGQEFLVSYALRDGCHSCAAIGKLQLAFDFDSDGKFTAVRVAQVVPRQQNTAGNLPAPIERVAASAF